VLALARPGPVVALDGPASSGKSSVGVAAAARLGLRFVDTGLLYRAVTALALRDGVATDDRPSDRRRGGRITRRKARHVSR
jgi:cytidylate kinase